MFNQNFKVMKQKIFTLIMMLALVVITGSAFAAVNSTVNQGGTYPYSVNGLDFHSIGYATINYDGSGASFYNVNGAGAAVSYTADDHIAYAAGAGTLTFNITYSLTATAGKITVLLHDNTSGCSNLITLAITVNNKPTFDLTIAADQDSYCQTTATTDDNTAASYHSVNTITYTVSLNSVTDAPSAGYTWGYTISIPNTTSPLGTYKVMYGATNITALMPYTISGIASTTTSEDFVVTFYSTTALANQTLTGAVSAGKVTDTGTGGATYNETTTPDTDAVTVKSLPAIGVFN
jgi:hypothetical protein